MPDAVSNTSPLLYLHRISAFDWLPKLFGTTWVPTAVVRELTAGRERGFDVPDVAACPWMTVLDPRLPASEWLVSDLGPGELAAISLALEHPERVLLLDDALARRRAHAAGLSVWGTLRILFEAKSHGLTDRIAPLVSRLEGAGMWLSDDVRRRILALAGE